MARDASATLGHEARTVGMVWRREILHFWRAKAGIVLNLLQPLLFLFVLGIGLNPVVSSSGGVNFMAFVFPGMLAMSVVTGAIGSGSSSVVDRQFGFLRVMMVAPVSRTSIVLGKVLGGATTATLQATILLALAPFLGVPLGWRTVVAALIVMLLLAVTLTGLGVLLASRVKRIQTFSTAMQFFMMPLVLLSGAMFPVQGLPVWLAVVTKLNPLTYAVDAVRRVMLSTQGLGVGSSSPLAHGVTVLGHTVGLMEEIAVMAAMAAVFVGLAARGLSRVE